MSPWSLPSLQSQHRVVRAMSLTLLPVELVSQVMCQCSDIATIVRLSSTCRKMQAVLRDNAKSIVATVLMNPSQVEFKAMLALARIEASIAKPGNEATTDQSDINATVYSQLFYIHRFADIMARLR